MPSPIDPDGWVAVDGATPPAAQLTLGDLGLFAEVTHAVRGPLLQHLRHPRSVAELAALVGAPQTRLYHHINKLESLGLVLVVATRRSGAATERRYQAVAESFRLDRDLLTSADQQELSHALGALFDLSKLALQREIESGAYQNLDDLEAESLLSRGQLRLSPARRADLVARLRAIVADFATDDDPDAPRFSLFIAAHPETPTGGA